MARIPKAMGMSGVGDEIWRRQQLGPMAGPPTNATELAAQMMIDAGKQPTPAAPVSGSGLAQAGTGDVLRWIGVCLAVSAIGWFVVLNNADWEGVGRFVGLVAGGLAALLAALLLLRLLLVIAVGGLGLLAAGASRIPLALRAGAVAGGLAWGALTLDPWLLAPLTAIEALAGITVGATGLGWLAGRLRR